MSKLSIVHQLLHSFLVDNTPLGLALHLVSPVRPRCSSASPFYGFQNTTPPYLLDPSRTFDLIAI